MLEDMDGLYRWIYLPLDDEGAACCLKFSDGLGVALPFDQGEGFVGGV
jgi:hypothetical protein